MFLFIKLDGYGVKFNFKIYLVKNISQKIVRIIRERLTFLPY